MPDRAVVICPRCEGERQTIKDHGSRVEDIDCPECDGKGYLPQPRALVALSDDGKWLVRYHRGLMNWLIYDECHWGYQENDMIRDTGQDAHDVLAEWLKERS